MKILLDTYVFLWFITGDKQLTPELTKSITNPANEIYLSAVSIWECIVKFNLGKLPLPESPDTYLPRQRERHLISSLPLDEASVAVLTRLPAIHRDPFDRMLICQALHHGLTLATVDTAIRVYPVANI